MAASPVFVKTTNASAEIPFVTHVLAPESRYPLAALTAVVCKLEKSDPASDSAKAKAPSHSPDASFLRTALR